ncbi:MAG: ABC transporter permease subunit [Actinomycetota bacterium]|nr:ABC transporter permease subunit [Actinomycetota bacterium]
MTLVLAYQWWSSSNQDPFFPTIPVMFDEFTQAWIGEGFTQNVLPSLTNLALGYLSGLILGVLGGIALGRIRFLRRASEPVVGFILTIPAIALLPLFLIFLGIGQQLQIGIIVFSVFFIVLVMTTYAVVGIESVLLDVCNIYRIHGLTRLTRVLFPAVIPQVLSAARITLSISVLVMVVSEMIGASNGIGATILLAQQSFDYGQMWAGMLLLAVLGISLNLLFTIGERTLLISTGHEVPSRKRIS